MIFIQHPHDLAGGGVFGSHFRRIKETQSTFVFLAYAEKYFIKMVVVIQSVHDSK